YTSTPPTPTTVPYTTLFRSEADDRIVAALFRERQRGHRQLERAGHPVDVGILDAVPLERILGAAQQSFRDVFVKARHDDCDVQVTSVQVGRDALLAHSVNYSRWPSLSFLVFR